MRYVLTWNFRPRGGLIEAMCQDLSHHSVAKLDFFDTAIGTTQGAILIGDGTTDQLERPKLKGSLHV